MIGINRIQLRNLSLRNITELIDEQGNIAAAYDYDPFGKVTQAGVGAGLNPIQWSSEHYDPELGLVYYNYRHYNPADGRWINRDPIAERGGMNLYGFVGNNSIENIDRHGNVFLGVQTIPQILRVNNFFDAARFMEHWFESTGSTLYEDIDKLLKTKKVMSKYQELLSAVTNKAARALIRKRIAHITPGERLYNNTPSEEAVKKDHVQSRLIESKYLSDNLDDFYAAYGDASLYAAVDGCVDVDMKTYEKKLKLDKIYVILYDAYNFIDHGYHQEKVMSQLLERVVTIFETKGIST